MKKSIAILLVITLIFSMSFVACKSKSDSNKTTAEQGLDSADNEFGIQTVEVTDKNGEVVTDKNGDPVTTEVAVKYELDKHNNTIAVVIDENGEPVTDENGDEVTVKPDIELTTTPDRDDDDDDDDDRDNDGDDNDNNDDGDDNGDNGGNDDEDDSEDRTEPTEVKTDGDEETTDDELTTLPLSKDIVPTVDEAIKKKDKKAVTFSSKDQQIVKNMLEVPYLYNDNYNVNAKDAGVVPINLAAHVALWMAEREGLNTKTYASGTIVLDLFKYFAQTVVNFKDNVNAKADNDNLVYNAKNDTFSIDDFESNKQTVTLTKIEYLGNNNYYLVTAKVDGIGLKASKVYAVIQKNKLDSSLGFSVKGLKWTH